MKRLGRVEVLALEGEMPEDGQADRFSACVAECREEPPAFLGEVRGTCEIGARPRDPGGALERRRAQPGREVPAAFHRVLEPAPAFAEVRPDPPEAPDRGGDAHEQLVLAGLAAPGQRGAQVVVLRLDPLRPRLEVAELQA